MSSKNYTKEHITPVHWYCTAENSQLIDESNTICVTTRHCVYYADLRLEEACQTFGLCRKLRQNLVCIQAT